MSKYDGFYGNGKAFSRKFTPNIENDFVLLYNKEKEMLFMGFFDFFKKRTETDEVSFSEKTEEYKKLFSRTFSLILITDF